MPRNSPSLLKHFVQFPREEFPPATYEKLGPSQFSRDTHECGQAGLDLESLCFDGNQNNSKYRCFDSFVCLEIIRSDID